MSEKTLSAKPLLYFAITVLSPLFPVCVLFVFPTIIEAREVFFVSLLLLFLTVWAWVGLWRSAKSQVIKILGMVMGGAGVVLSLVLVVCAGMLFRIIS